MNKTLDTISASIKNTFIGVTSLQLLCFRVVLFITGFQAFNITGFSVILFVLTGGNLYNDEDNPEICMKEKSDMHVPQLINLSFSVHSFTLVSHSCLWPRVLFN